MRELLAPSGRLTRWGVLAAAVAGVAWACAAASLGLQLVHREAPESVAYWLNDTVSAVLYGAAVVIMLPRSRHPVVAIVAAVALGTGVASLLTQVRPVLEPGDLSFQLYVVSVGAWVPGVYASLAVVPWLVGDGFAPRVRRVLLVVGATAVATSWLSVVTNTYPVRPRNVFAVPWEPWQQAVQGLGLWPDRVCLVVAVLGAAHLARTWWRHRGTETTGFGWLAIGQALVSAALVPAVAVRQETAAAVELTGLGLLLAQAFLPIALLVVVLRQQLWGIDVTVSRVTVWSLITGVVLGGYAVLVWLVGMVVPGSRGVAGFLAVGLVVALGQPLRFWVQERVDRLVYGHRDDPVQLLAALGQGLTGLTDRAALQSLVDALRAGLRLGGVQVVADDGRVEASSGRLGPTVQSSELVAEGRRVGQLRVSAPSGVALDARTRRVVGQMLGLVAVALELALVNERLRAATDRVVEVRHEERRMIRRDLHDGMGPALAGVGLGLAAAQRRLGHDPEGTARLLAELEAEVERRTEDVRLMARALLPTQLDDGDLGLALEVLADRFRTSGLLVEVDARALGSIDTRRQVAVYHVAAEALMNSHRHARATSVCIRVASREGGSVVLEVLDDGAGLDTARRVGIGIQSMRERAAELGGRLDVGARAGRPGTHVTMELP